MNIEINIEWIKLFTRKRSRAGCGAAKLLIKRSWWDNWYNFYHAGTSDSLEIANRISCRANGVENIEISPLLIKINLHPNAFNRTINDRFQEACPRNQFLFVSNNFTIMDRCLWKNVIHLQVIDKHILSNISLNFWIFVF